MAELVFVPKADWKAALDATREKGGTSALLTSSQLAPAIRAISGGGSTDYSGFADGTLTGAVVGETATRVRSYAFLDCGNLLAASFPQATSVGRSGFEACYDLETAELPRVQSLDTSAFFNDRNLLAFDAPELTAMSGTYIFGNCTALTRFFAPRVTAIPERCFDNAGALAEVDISAVETIGLKAFRHCKNITRLKLTAVRTMASDALSDTGLIALILSGPTVCTLEQADALRETPIAAGTGYIYVPRALAEQYKAAPNWSTYAGQIRAIEDYPTETGG